MAAPTAADLEGAIRVILATAKLEDVTQRTLREQLEAQFGCELAGQKSVIKEITIRVLSEREEEAEAREAQEKAAAKAAIKREVNLAPQHSSDDESHDGSSNGSDDEEEEVKPKFKKAKREVDEDEVDEEEVGRKKTAKKKGGGFNREQAWSEEMTAFLGEGYMSRPQVTKRVWDYIKEKNLQNPVDRRVILCDPILKSLFGGVEKINMFKMPKAINKHVRHNDREEEDDEEEEEEEEDEEEVDSDDEGDSRKRKTSSAAKAKTEKKKKKEKKAAAAAAAAAAATPGKKKKKTVKKEEGEGGSAKKGGGRGFPQERISSELQALVGKETASRNEVVKKLWEHIKANDMQDPSNRMNILCDATFKKILGVDSVHGFKMNKLLAPHFLGRA